MINELTSSRLLTPIYTIIGIIIGALLTFITSWFLKKRETKLKISSQLIKKRINAHEKILTLAKTMRATLSIDKINTENVYITYPIIFQTKESFQNWRSSFFLTTNEYSHWLGLKVTRELYFIQDYIVNLDKRLEKVPSENYLQIGIILRNDFLSMASNVEKEVISYFESGWKNLKIEKNNKWHKFPKKVSLKRLEETNLYKRHLEIHKYLNKEEKSIPRDEIKQITELYNIAPNGLKVDMVTLREVPNIDNSGVKYELTYKDCEDYGDKMKFGHCELVGGRIMFDKIDKNAQILGIDYKAIKLLVNWIEENIEDIDYLNETIEYE
ncbi:hypothetical protein LA303_07690 [Candidatus Sulfidibacterium hydrothermale]|uniref:hypothetical protein n=1 Tax=Candidatus Sulfidibacterium hydrothermale TaxID=2875962 RepID=UPI001F0A66DF|nr:hypothetical protein [Candidatus Sulfidibacterium hydrothermale]UBM61304.1 hypothetical protein LA303_07690 [Candidatus Sulfidibacterium hydrothermale]